MSEWQLIETAPKDGTRIRVGNLLDSSSMKPTSIFKTTGSYVDGKWVCSSAFVCTDGMLRWQPTHWLPDTPERH